MPTATPTPDRSPNVLKSLGDIQVVESLDRVPATREREFQIVVVKAVPGTSSANMYVCLGDNASTTAYAWIPLGMSIKSIQRGTIALVGVDSNTATITSVDTTKSVLRHLGQITNGTSVPDGQCHLVLTNATTITATKSSANNNATVSYEVVEYN